MIAAAPRLGSAQSGSAGEGALDLLLPTGARSIGMGQAAVSAATGTDAVWWNPALIGRATRREGGYSFAQSLFTENDNTLAALVPVSRIGGAAITVRSIDYGEQEAGDVIGPTGLLATRSLIALASFGAPLGPVSIGLSFKVLRQGFSCSGSCPNIPQHAAMTSAVDLGASYHAEVGGHRIGGGASLVNVGRPLQVKDAPQADPLPRRIQGGVSVTPKLPAIAAGASITLAADVITRTNGIGEPGLRAGAELSWENKYQLRGGYARHAATGSGLSLGVGMNTGKLQLDLARFVSDLSASTGSPPTFLSLRYLF
jgi:hypothetical protein